MIKSEVETRNGKKGVSLIITGETEELYNEFRALFTKVINNDDLFSIANDAMVSVKQDIIIQNYKEKK